MIKSWEISPAPHERYPGRLRVNVDAEPGDLEPLLSSLPRNAGRPWKPRLGRFRLAFYAYDLSPADRKNLEAFLASGGANGIPASGAKPAATAPPAEADVNWSTILGEMEKNDDPSPPEGRTPAPNAPERPATPAATLDAERPASSLPPGFTLLRLGYIFPKGAERKAVEVHKILSEMLEARRMPFVVQDAVKTSFPGDAATPERLLRDIKATDRNHHNCLGVKPDFKDLYDL
ncbi:MAG: hypothetical protein ACT4O3_00925, partial [Elusimicrobiota bacterium]